MKYLIFVDFDGVLTSNRIHFAMHDAYFPMWSKFDPIVMDFFNKLHYTYDDVSFVWTTTWRNGLDAKDPLLLHNLYSQWYNAGFRGKFGDPWKVNPDDTLPIHKRADEVKDYLINYAHNYKDFLIIDDTDYDFNKVLGIKRFIKTDANDGMLFKHMKNAWSLTGNWDKK